MYGIVPRIQVQELAARLASEDASRVQIVDVRSDGYYDSGSARIKNSIRIEPNNPIGLRSHRSPQIQWGAGDRARPMKVYTRADPWRLGIPEARR